MKYIVLILDGAADYPLEELNWKTPLEEAYTPNLDFIAKKGRGGLLKTLFKGLPKGSDVANLAILGYDPRKCYTGRGAIEAKALGIELSDEEIAFRCNLITLKDEKIEDYSAGHISTQDAKEIISILNKELDIGRFYAGVSYRNIFIVDAQGCDPKMLKSTPPHEILGEPISQHLIRGECSSLVDKLNKLMIDSIEVLKKSKADMIWLWGQGKKLELESFENKYGLKAGVISAVDLIKGIAGYARMRVIEVEGATGYYDTDYKAKGKAAVDSIKTLDFTYIHVEAPDEAGHEGNVEEKIRAIENIDREILGRILDSGVEVKIAALPDHATPIKVRTHTADPVPFIIYSPKDKGDEIKKFSEREAIFGSFGIRNALELMQLLLS